MKGGVLNENTEVVDVEGTKLLMGAGDQGVLCERTKQWKRDGRLNLLGLTERLDRKAGDFERSERRKCSNELY